MVVPVLLIVFAIAIVIFGQPNNEAESLYYDADFVEVDDADSAKTVGTGEDDVPAEIETVSVNGKDEVDAAALAQSIYDSVDL